MIFLFFFDREIILDIPENHNEFAVKWKRWKRNVIDKQIATANGAERYLKNGHKIFLEKGLVTEMPIKYNAKNIVVHKIIIANGAERACKKFSEQNINGSLVISYSDSIIVENGLKMI